MAFLAWRGHAVPECEQSSIHIIATIPNRSTVMSTTAKFLPISSMLLVSVGLIVAGIGAWFIFFGRRC